MPTVSLKLIPTVNAEYTPTLNQAGISECQFIRFQAGLPQKLGGWEKFFPTSVNGVPKDLHAWSDLNSDNHLAIGATDSLSVITSDLLQDITPQTLVSDFAPDFTTTNLSANVDVTDTNISGVTTYDSIFFNTPISVGGIILQGAHAISTILGADDYRFVNWTAATASESNAGTVPAFATTSGEQFVTVTLADHGLAIGDSFTFPISTLVGGLEIIGTYRVTGVPDADNFQIAASSVATSTDTEDMNGGDCQLVYYLALGPDPTGTGYGIGAYGVGPYGVGSSSGGQQIGVPITTTNWTLDNWGETLLACPQFGGIYAWTPNTGFQNAQLIATAPISNGGIFVSMPEQILVAWGSTVSPTAQAAQGIQRDPLWVNWSTVLDYTNWLVTSTTQAGGFRIPEGSKIVGALQGQHQALFWTDIALWAMQYIGPPLVYGWNKIGSGCGLIGMHAKCQMRGTVFWMSSGNFFTMTGNGVTPIPCPVWDYVFQDLDKSNEHKCIAAPNSSFDEVWFFFPSISGGTGEPDKYVKFNLTEQSWDFGEMNRSCWEDQSVLGQPLGCTSAGIIYQHETSLNADGQPLEWYFTTGWFVISDAQDIMFLDWIFPDCRWGLYNSAQTATVMLTIEAVDYPNAPVRTYGPFTMTQATQYINCRLRGRQLRLTFSGNDLNSFARLGNPRYRIAPDGRL